MQFPQAPSQKTVYSYSKKCDFHLDTQVFHTDVRKACIFAFSPLQSEVILWFSLNIS